MPRQKRELDDESVEDAVERVRSAAVGLGQDTASTGCGCNDSDVLILKCRMEKASLVIGWMLNHGKFDEQLTSERMTEFENAARIAAGVK